jgi:hypothetical protein
MDNADILTVRLEDGVLFFAEGDHEVPGKAISNRCFFSEFELGVFEFEDTPVDGVKIVVRGKATRYYPLHEQEYRASRVIRYLIDVPPV